MLVEILGCRLLASTSSREERGLSRAEQDGECRGPKQTHPGRESVKAGTHCIASVFCLYRVEEVGRDFW